MGTMFNALTSFISEAIILFSTEMILFGIAFLGYIMMNSSSLRTAGDKSEKLSASIVVTASQCTCEEIDSDEDESVAEHAILPLTAPQDPNLNAVRILGGLTTELAANVFAFTELSDVLNCAGLACRGLQKSIWCQPDFWVGLGGPLFVDSLCATGRPSTIAPMIGSFRRWVFGLDGDWSLQVEQLGSIGHAADALRSVLGYVQVLQAGDAALCDVRRLVRAAEGAMQRADGRDDKLLRVASELVDTCQKRQDIFGSIDTKDLNAALVAMEKRAEQERSTDERNHWFFSDEVEPSDPRAWHASDADNCLLSLSFLAVMDQQS